MGNCFCKIKNKGFSQRRWGIGKEEEKIEGAKEEGSKWSDRGVSGRL